MPVSSVPSPTPGASARGSAAARADSPLPLATPAASEGARTAAARQGDPPGLTRSSQRKSSGTATDTPATSETVATAKHADSQPPHTDAPNASVAGTPGASFGQTLSATRAAAPSTPAIPATSATPATPALPLLPTPQAGSAELLGASARGTAGGAATSATESGADEPSGPTPETQPAPSGNGSLHEGDAAAPGNNFFATARGAGAALAPPVTPPAASISPAASTSPAASDPDSVGADPAAAPVGVAARAVAIPTQRLAQLNQALDSPSAAGAAPPARTTDDAADTAEAQASLTPASLDTASQPSEPARLPSAAVEAQPLHSEVGSAAWGNELGARLTLMAQQGIASASLRLSPAHLGPLEVRIAVRDASASVWFGSPQSDTRAALEQSLPRLRELFAGQGLNLTHAGVSGETPRGASYDNTSPALPVPADAAHEANAISVTPTPLARHGLIDTYA